MKTVRFSHVVAASGRPEVHTLWTAPDRDRELQRARAAHRVMTIGHARGRTDTGSVGFETAKNPGEILIFPKSLKRFAGARVVGVKFDQVDQPRLSPAKLNVLANPPSRAGGEKKSSGESKRAAARERDAALAAELRTALQELAAGKSAAARRRLARAMARD